MVRIYRITSVLGGTFVGAGSIAVLAKGRIVQVLMTGAALGGAAAGRQTVEVALNNTANSNSEVASLASTDNIVCRQSIECGTTTAANVTTVIPLNIPVNVGNTLCLNGTGTGTSFGAVLNGADIYVQEGS